MRYFESKWPAILLWPLSLLYGFATRLRNILYDCEILKQHQVACKVISIGNITVGGTGKTPTVIFLSEWLTRQGFKVAVLSRGYGRRSKGTVIVSDGTKILVGVRESGDEPQMIARRLKNIPVIVDENRVRGAEQAIDFFSPDVLILDDAFQHRRLFRDVDILLLKKSPVWGNSYLLPAGPLRESTKAIKRADIVWNNFEINSEFKNHSVNANVVPANILSFGGGEINDTTNTRLIAVSGIANPAQFHKTCRQMDLAIILSITFNDHHQYTVEEIESINNKAAELGIDWIITTEKDFVKLEQFPQTSSKWVYLPIKICPQNEQTLTYITQLLA